MKQEAVRSSTYLLGMELTKERQFLEGNSIHLGMQLGTRFLQLYLPTNNSTVQDKYHKNSDRKRTGMCLMNKEQE